MGLEGETEVPQSVIKKVQKKEKAKVNMIIKTSKTMSRKKLWTKWDNYKETAYASKNVKTAILENKHRRSMEQFY